MAVSIVHLPTRQSSHADLKLYLHTCDKNPTQSHTKRDKYLLHSHFNGFASPQTATVNHAVTLVLRGQLLNKQIGFMGTALLCEEEEILLVVRTEQQSSYGACACVDVSAHVRCLFASCAHVRLRFCYSKIAYAKLAKLRS